jgi:hypothetical protein
MLARDAHDGTTSQAGDAETGHRIGQAAASGDAADTDLTAAPRIGIGGICTGLLVAHVNELHVIVPEVGEDGKRVTTVDRKEILDPLLLENAPDEGAAIHRRHLLFPPLLASPIQRAFPIHLRGHGSPPGNGLGLNLARDEITWPNGGLPPRKP